jgi:heme-degrading monooxygenase HmoA
MYVILWEFEVKPERCEEFRSAYGPEGDWAILFRQADGYQGTELLAPNDIRDRFVTVDRWRTAEHFARFKAEFAAAYRTLDQRFEGLTRTETSLGNFTLVG